MFTQDKGCIRLFRLAGITVFLHWSWFLVAFLELELRRDKYDSLAWNVAEYLTLFGIVLLHEFGHAMACRQVGGKAERIVLWPMGGVAFVNPPPRPGALLWSIVAGPLVNVLLVPVSIGLCFVASSVSGPLPHGPFNTFCHTVAIQWRRQCLAFSRLRPMQESKRSRTKAICRGIGRNEKYHSRALYPPSRNIPLGLAVEACRARQRPRTSRPRNRCAGGARSPAISRGRGFPAHPPPGFLASPLAAPVGGSGFLGCRGEERASDFGGGVAGQVERPGR
jgi:hypothetical protein